MTVDLGLSNSEAHGNKGDIMKVWKNDHAYRLDLKVRLVDGGRPLEQLITIGSASVVELQVRYENTDRNGTLQEAVKLKLNLPEQLELVSRSTVLINSENPEGKTLEDGIDGEGVQIGDYPVGANAYVRLRVKAVAEKIKHKEMSLPLWVQAEVKQASMQDFRQVTMVVRKR